MNILKNLVLYVGAPVLFSCRHQDSLSITNIFFNSKISNFSCYCLIVLQVAKFRCIDE